MGSDQPPQYEGVPRRFSIANGVGMVVIQPMPARSAAQPATGAVKSAMTASGRWRVDHRLQLGERLRQDREVLPQLGQQSQRVVAHGLVGVADALEHRRVVGEQRIDGEAEALQEGYAAGRGREPYVVALVAQPLPDGDQRVEVAGERWRGEEQAAHQGSWAARVTRSATSGSRA